ncbi:MAG TPA: NAD(P)H-hydrate dehydratase [Gammaproteobacteria bacterium]|nr:NAD(P)H-hydrate dehydratase [Gammaproteobacteria bacterium]
MKGSDQLLPRAIYSAAQVRELERIAIQERGIPSYTLMNRAAEAALRVLRAHWPSARKVLICCGAGNNAGDGYVLARLAAAAGLTVRVLALVPAERLQGDAARAARDCVAAGGAVDAFDATASPVLGFAADVVVDALLGTGLDRPLGADFERVVAGLNAASIPVLALDIPTGLHADTGLPLGNAIRASVTVTFVGLKQGLFLGVARDYCGVLEFADLDIPADSGRALRPPLNRLTAADLTAALPRRARTAHKGAHGRLLLVGGGPGMSGAIRLAAEAALRAGAGLADVATHPHSVATVMAGRPEIMCHAIETAESLDELLELADGVVAGPGLGRSEWSSALWRRILATDLPLVVDADALNMLAVSPHRRRNWILTPHPGEAARLLAKPAAEIQLDRLGAVSELARRYGAVAVLKGACSLIACTDDLTYVCDRGNPGMAAAGMGDVLAGVLGALVVQIKDLGQSARAGVLLHALAGDAAAEDGERGLLASDLMPQIRRWANPS